MCIYLLAVAFFALGQKQECSSGVESSLKIKEVEDFFKQLQAKV